MPPAVAARSTTLHLPAQSSLTAPAGMYRWELGKQALDSGWGSIQKQEAGRHGGRQWLCQKALALSKGVGPGNCSTSRYADAGPCHLFQHLLATVDCRMASEMFRSRVWRRLLAPASASQQGFCGDVSLFSITKIVGSCFLQFYPETTENSTAFIQPTIFFHCEACLSCLLNEKLHSCFTCSWFDFTQTDKHCEGQGITEPFEQATLPDMWNHAYSLCNVLWNVYEMQCIK